MNLLAGILGFVAIAVIALSKEVGKEKYYKAIDSFKGDRTYKSIGINLPPFKSLSYMTKSQLKQYCDDNNLEY